MIPADVRRALRRWRDNRDVIVEVLADQGVTALVDDERDNLLSAANELAMAIDRWLPSPTPTKEK